MNVGKFKQWLFFGSFAMDALILDQVTKWLARTQSWSHVQQNHGIAFGVQLHDTLQLWGSIAILSLLIWVGVTDLFKVSANRFINPILLGIIVGGALGNLLDRVRLGSVTDFILLKPFPVFNLADVFITVGLLVLLFFNRSSLSR